MHLRMHMPGERPANHRGIGNKILVCVRRVAPLKCVALWSLIWARILFTQPNKCLKCFSGYMSMWWTLEMGSTVWNSPAVLG